MHSERNSTFECFWNVTDESIIKSTKLGKYECLEQLQKPNFQNEMKYSCFRSEAIEMLGGLWGCLVGCGDV